MKTNDDRSTTREFYKLPSGATLTRRPTGFPNRANKYMDSRRRRRRVWRRWGRRRRRRRRFPLLLPCHVFPSLCNCITNVHLFCQPVFCIITSRALGPLQMLHTRDSQGVSEMHLWPGRTDGNSVTRRARKVHEMRLGNIIHLKFTGKDGWTDGRGQSAEMTTDKGKFIEGHKLQSPCVPSSVPAAELWVRLVQPINKYSRRHRILRSLI